MKCAVSDFDRTLYVNNTISDRNLTSIQKWQSSGNWFVVATGRNADSLKDSLSPYHLHPDALILNNGAVILNQNWEELYCKTIDQQTAVEVLTFLHGLNSDGSGVTMRHKKVNILSSHQTTTQKPCGGDLSIEEIHTLTHIVQIHRRNRDEKEIQKLCKQINSEFPSVNAYANVWNADIVAQGVDKSTAIDWLARYHGGFESIKVIGDSANDLRMIEVYRGATLREAAPEVQAVASQIVEDVAQYLLL